MQPPTQPPHPDWWHHVSLACRTCGCVFRLEPSDDAHVYSTLGVVEATCPACGEPVTARRPVASSRAAGPRQVRPQ